MDERYSQIREGAGLEESKLNVEFIEWLRRWSTPLMMVAAITAAGYFLYQRYEKAQLAKVDRAFQELETALSTASPESLKSVADEYDGVRGVSVMARLGAADAYLRSARTGIKPGAAPKQDGTFDAADVLGDKDREAMLADAEKLYTQVLAGTESNERESLHAIGAAFGLAAVAESRGQTDQAKKQYDRIVDLSQKGGYTTQGDIAKKRLESLSVIGDSTQLLAKADLPTPPSPPPPPAPPVPATPPGAPTGGPIGGANPGLTFTPTTPPPTGATGVAPVPVPESTPPATTAPTGATGATGVPASTGSPAPTGNPAPPAPPTGTPAPAPQPK
jgi:hypothetical protein